MVSHMVNVVQSTLLVSIIVSALCAVIAGNVAPEKRRRMALKPFMWATIAGIVMAGVVTLVHLLLPRQINRQTVTLCAAAIIVILSLVLLILVWVVRFSPARRSEQASTVTSGRLLPKVDCTFTLCGLMYTVLLFFTAAQPPLLQLKTLVSVNSEVFSTDTALNLSGYLLGIALVTVIAVGLYRAGLVAHQLTLWLLTAMMLLMGLNSALMIVRIFQARRYLKLPAKTFSYVAWFINHENIVMLVGLVFVVVIACAIWWKAKRIDFSGRNPAEKRLHRARSRSWRRLSAQSILACSGAALVLTIGVALGSSEVELSPPEPMAVTATQAVIELDKISDGHLHRFSYKTSTGAQVRFIVIQKSGSSFGVGLDACEICGPSGYYEKARKIICKLCEVAMNIATIGFKGGCNPIPIEFSVQNGQLTVPLAELEAASSIFA